MILNFLFLKVKTMSNFHENKFFISKMSANLLNNKKHLFVFQNLFKQASKKRSFQENIGPLIYILSVAYSKIT